ncbi:hypothetical protein H6G54_04475 [Anabaena cylindrica FACHB-243]|uniref:Uncharacterized protein n=1 Tax=Anabaena cylindrica (strain ATCC 27899 / PCC 7122) TaxID=272123 RepID=K9ZGS4_ANACC|nr:MULTISPECIES: hypothetical protein [Anabaena]AFZ58386.1 hypothetical protein Anacy_2964 [Anabaena cylindrica PCC 7122]MBD2416982.1 hypothetical protein [Anabaena cylindrica FACHB-243]MBY5280197.1 hypothetical protein [Anabaena sp. CCAP 1446/1C]MBY5309360.1 hypothetical protein [Anabaena sp. CCAP 1446/1C]MCM2406516.1 hypothetical protein [Anabaena sp. CCAP 1446/1C]
MQAKEIKEKLKSLIDKASTIDPQLAKRLNEINRWVRLIRPGSLTAKPFVLAFLLEVITDSTIWLIIQSLPSEAAREAKFAQMTPNERYWYSYLFPRWINSTDAKFYIWKKKIMAGEFNHLDGDIIKLIAQDVVRREGSFWQRYIADLSMATDLIISNHQQKPLCIQVTSVSEEFHGRKYEKWQNALQLWEIERGLFLSYNPGSSDFINQLVNVALYNSDHLAEGKYVNFS